MLRFAVISMHIMIAILSLLNDEVSAFGVPSLLRSTSTTTSILTSTSTTYSGRNQRSTTRLYEGNIEQIEFKIFPDGRIEEVVRGVKGGNCHKVTEGINEKLGKVVLTQPTEEMYEQEVVIDQTLTETVGDGSSSSSSSTGDSWEGTTSW